MLRSLVPSALLVFVIAVTIGITPLTARALEWRSAANGQRFQQLKSIPGRVDGHAHAAALSMRELRSPAITASATAAGELTPLFGNLGGHRHRITTGSELAQRYFDEGLILTYGFNHAEAIRSFRDALTLDPNCAMCYWGIASRSGRTSTRRWTTAAVPEARRRCRGRVELAPSRQSGRASVHPGAGRPLRGRARWPTGWSWTWRTPTRCAILPAATPTTWMRRRCSPRR